MIVITYYKFLSFFLFFTLEINNNSNENKKTINNNQTCHLIEILYRVYLLVKKKKRFIYIIFFLFHFYLLNIGKELTFLFGKKKLIIIIIIVIIIIFVVFLGWSFEFSSKIKKKFVFNFNKKKHYHDKDYNDVIINDLWKFSLFSDKILFTCKKWLIHLKVVIFYVIHFCLRVLKVFFHIIIIDVMLSQSQLNDVKLFKFQFFLPFYLPHTHTHTFK